MKTEFKMDYRKIIDESDNLVYVSDPETNELVFINKTLLDAYGYDPDYAGKPCYEVLQDKDSPCEFCSNKQLSEDKFYCWSHFNDKLNRYFALKDKLIDMNGRKLRMEVCVDLTEQYNEIRHLNEKNLLDNTLIRCIRKLQNDNIDEGVNDILAEIAEYYDADRAYIFEIDWEKRVTSNTYEFCKAGVTSEKDFLQNIPVEVIRNWLEIFKDNGNAVISSLEKIKKINKKQYEILKAQDIVFIGVVPLFGSDVIEGFIGVDNPHKYYDNVYLLQEFARFMHIEFERRRVQNKLGYLSYHDVLTGLWNRNKYILQIDLYSECPPDSLGIIFMDLNRLKEYNDSFGHSEGDKRIVEMANIIKKYEKSYRIGGDEFVVFFENITKDDFCTLCAELYEKVKGNAALGCEWSDKTEDVDSLAKKADDRMYEQKGRRHSDILIADDKIK